MKSIIKNSMSLTKYSIHILKLVVGVCIDSRPTEPDQKRAFRRSTPKKSGLSVGWESGGVSIPASSIYKFSAIHC